MARMTHEAAEQALARHIAMLTGLGWTDVSGEVCECDGGFVLKIRSTDPRGCGHFHRVGLPAFLFTAAEEIDG